MSNFEKPEQNFRPHGGPYKGRPAEDLVEDPGGRAWLAGHVPTQRIERQQIALAWLSWALQRDIRLEDLHELAGSTT